MSVVRSCKPLLAKRERKVATTRDLFIEGDFASTFRIA